MPELHPDAPGDPASLIGQLVGGDPRLAMLMQFMQARHRPEEAAPEAEEEAGRVAELTERLALAEARLAQVTAKARRLWQQAREDARRLSDLAAALSACGLCWGEDGRCPSCRGRGRPGMLRPDLDLRARLLGPRRTGARAAEQPPTSNLAPTLTPDAPQRSEAHVGDL